MSSFDLTQNSTLINLWSRVRPVSTEAAREAWGSMHALFMDGEAHDRVHRICAELGLSPPLLKAFVHLGTLDGDGGLRMSDLAETWGFDASYVTALADGLQQRGLAERRPHPTDRRGKTIVLTPPGGGQRGAGRELVAPPAPPFGSPGAAAAPQRRGPPAPPL